MNKKLPDFAGLMRGEPIPEIRQPHLVQCTDSLHLAFQDKSGQWKSFSNGRVLTDFIKVFAS